MPLFILDKIQNNYTFDILHHKDKILSNFDTLNFR